MKDLRTLLELAANPRNNNYSWIGSHFADGGLIEDPVPQPIIPSTRSTKDPHDWVRDWYKNRSFGDERDLLMNTYRDSAVRAIEQTPIQLEKSLKINDNTYAAGWYEPTDKTIKISTSSPSDENATIIHELSHAGDLASDNRMYYPDNASSFELDSNGNVPYNGEFINKINKMAYDKNIVNDHKDFIKNSGYEWDYTDYYTAKNELEKLTGYHDGMNADDFYKNLSKNTSRHGNKISDLSAVIEAYHSGNVGDKTSLYDMISGRGKMLDDTELFDRYGNKDEYNYLKTPTEISSRLMEMRYDMGVDPKEKITKDKYDKFIKNNPDMDYLKDLMKVTKEGHDSILDMLNNFVDSTKNNKDNIKNS